MVKNNVLQQAIADTLSSQPPEQIATSTLRLWESIAATLTPIIGEHGFTILYTRSIHLTQTDFPWLAVGKSPQKSESQFALLVLSFYQRDAGEAAEASKALFVTFTDILAVLIGEPLTIGILRATWGNDVLETTPKETDYE